MTTTPLRAAAAALALTVLTACGGTGSSSENGTDTAAATSGETATSDANATESSGSEDDSGEASGQASDGGTAGASESGSSTDEGSPTETASSSEGTNSAPPGELPRGGKTLFPDYQLVGFSGLPGAAALGRMGIGKLDDRVKEMDELGKTYATGTDRKNLPTLELIATIVHAKPGADGMFRTRIDEKVVQEHLDAARRHQGILLLNIQPGRADFMDEARFWEKFLKEPDVGLALDPEWKTGPGQIPGRVFGSVDGSELDEVSQYLSKIVADNGLPEKPMVVHQLRLSIIKNEKALQKHPGVVAIKSVDGIGSKSLKLKTWNVLTKDMSPAFHAGFKLFYEEDTRHGKLMTPQDVKALTPYPEYVLYE